MNFIEAIEKHNTRLDAYVKTKSFGGADTNELRELISIFMEYVSNPKGDMIPSLGCGNCVNKMFQRLVTHREIERQKNIDFFNAVSNAHRIQIELSEVEGAAEANALSDTITSDKVHITNFVGADVPIETGLTLTPTNQLDLEDQIKQEEIEKFKQLCDEQGIKYHHKSGIKKLKELLNE